ncbi:MAG: hypothetical protein NTU88_11820 [Armatimonadetes bacterium]|nr:hypothetical protein [Armatimonadota bacterium]
MRARLLFYVYGLLVLSAIVLQAAFPEVLFGIVLIGLIIVVDSVVSATPLQCVLRASASCSITFGTALVHELIRHGLLRFTWLSESMLWAITGMVVGSVAISWLSRGIRRRVAEAHDGLGLASTRREPRRQWSAVEYALSGITLAVLVAIVVPMAVGLSAIAQDDRAYTAADHVAETAGKHYESAMEAYQHYLSRYPQGLHEWDARERLDDLSKLIDEREWTNAKRIGTVEAYQAYMKRFPSGEWWQAAEREIEDALTMKKAQSVFAAGQQVYLYDPIPTSITGSAGECMVSFIRRNDATVRGELVARYVFRGGRVGYVFGWAFSALGGGPLPRLADRRGSLSVEVHSLLSELSRSLMDRPA